MRFGDKINNLKGQKMNTKNKKYFYLKNVKVDWNSMGMKQKDYNNNDLMIHNGRIYSYDSRFCKRGELVLCSYHTRGHSKEQILDNLLGGHLGYEDSWLYQKYGLMSESFDVHLFDELENEILTKEVISYEDIRMKEVLN